MRLTLTLLCILGVSLAGSSQDKNFDLSKYKFPDYKRHQLEFNFNSSGNSNSYFAEVPQTTNMNTTTYDKASFRFNSNSTMWLAMTILPVITGFRNTIHHMGTAQTLILDFATPFSKLS